MKYALILITALFVCLSQILIAPALAKRGGPLTPYQSFSFETDQFALTERVIYKTGNKLLSLRLSPTKTFYIGLTSKNSVESAWFYVYENEKKQFTTAEKKALKKWIEENPDAFIEASHSVQRFLSFILDFMPANEEVKDYQASFFESLVDDKPKNPFSMICEEIGKPRKTTFTRAKTDVEVELIVGQRGTKCRGRCGTGCWQFGQSMTNQYTDECFTHDACTTTEGSILGECEDEFWAASDGYFDAPNCTQEAID